MPSAARGRGAIPDASRLALSPRLCLRRDRAARATPGASSRASRRTTSPPCPTIRNYLARPRPALRRVRGSAGRGASCAPLRSSPVVRRSLRQLEHRRHRSARRLARSALLAATLQPLGRRRPPLRGGDRDRQADARAGAGSRARSATTRGCSSTAASPGIARRPSSCSDEALATSQELGLKGWLDMCLETEAPRAGRRLGKRRPTTIDIVAASVGSKRPDLAPHAAPDGTVTLMFSDMEGFTAMTDRLGDLEAREVIRAHNAIVREQTLRPRRLRGGAPGRRLPARLLERAQRPALRHRHPARLRRLQRGASRRADPRAHRPPHRRGA